MILDLLPDYVEEVSHVIFSFEASNITAGMLEEGVLTFNGHFASMKTKT